MAGGTASPCQPVWRAGRPSGACGNSQPSHYRPKVVGSGGVVDDVEPGAQQMPHVRGKLSATVRGDDLWHAKCAIHPVMRVSAHQAVVVEDRGRISTHLVVLLMIVNTLRMPVDVGDRGPTH